MESSISAVATLLVYVDAALVCNASPKGKLLLLALLICSAGLLAITNATTTTLHMFGRAIQVKCPRQKYNRRLDMADQLIKESGRNDWALRLGLITPDPQHSTAEKLQVPVVM